MAQAIKELKKLGARNKIINDSVDEMMNTILEMRRERLARELQERREASQLKIAIA